MKFGSLIAGGVCLALSYFLPSVIDVLHVSVFGWNVIGNAMAYVLTMIGGYLVISGLFGK